MAARQFVFPKVKEIRVTRDTPRVEAIAAPAQRDLVVASLLFCPYGKEQVGGRQGRTG